MRIALRSLGWLLIAAGATVALYLVYSLYWTGRSTSAAQGRLLEEFREEVAAEPFDLEVGDLDPLEPTEEAPEVDRTDVAVGDAIAVMAFERDGAPVVSDEPVVVVEGVTVDALKDGPGRYPGTAYPGEDGNFAVAGHRTTYGAPFWDLDQLREGDEVHVTDRAGTTWIYEVAEQRVVAPSDISVLEPDPIGAGAPLLTLTTCHPRWSQRERLIVFAELVDQQVAGQAVGQAVQRR
jgi:sortase A